MPSVYQNLISTRRFNPGATSAGIRRRASETRIACQCSNAIAPAVRRTVGPTGFLKGATNWLPVRNNLASPGFGLNREETKDS
jgi:hypothetical protein